MCHLQPHLTLPDRGMVRITLPPLLHLHQPLALPLHQLVTRLSEVTLAHRFKSLLYASEDMCVLSSASTTTPSAPSAPRAAGDTRDLQLALFVSHVFGC